MHTDVLSNFMRKCSTPPIDHTIYE